MKPDSSKFTPLKISYLSLAGNLLLALIKAFAGIVGHSFALVADAVESTTDVFSSLLIIFGLRYAKKPADDNHPFGHGKIEPVVTFIVVMILMASALFIAYQSILNIQSPHESPKAWTLIVLGLIIIWKEFAYRLMSKKGKESYSSSLQAEAWHNRSDAITSLAAFIGICIAVIAGEGYESADDWAALLASGFIIYNAYLIFRPALGEIMDEHRYDDLIEQIREESHKVEGVIDTEKCFIRKSGMHFHVDLHVTVKGSISVQAGHDIAHTLSDHLKAVMPQLEHILIHIEPDTLLN